MTNNRHYITGNGNIHDPAMENIIYRGVLTNIGELSFLAGDNGSRHLESENIWSGYVTHWSGKMVCARRLPQKDYETGRPLLILWPDTPVADTSLVELYFNERLVKYPLSFLGHLAVLVNGKVFNFSHWMNENEAESGRIFFPAGAGRVRAGPGERTRQYGRPPKTLLRQVRQAFHADDSCAENFRPRHAQAFRIFFQRTGKNPQHTAQSERARQVPGLSYPDPELRHHYP